MLIGFVSTSTYDAGNRLTEAATLMAFLNFIFYSLSGIAIISFPFLLVNWMKYLRRRASTNLKVRSSYGFPVKSTLVFVTAIALAIILAEIISARSRTEALNFLQGLSGHYDVYINQRSISDSATVISALKALSPAVPHHSHPTNRIQVDIQNEKGTLHLELRRDSDNLQEYWVYYPKYTVTSNNEIGRINTTVFDAY